MPFDDKTSILTYPIGSGDMRYMLENMRTVYLHGDAANGFDITGEVPEAGEISRANLAEILLEMALTWDAPKDHPHSPEQMGNYGTHIGQALAQAVMASTPDSTIWQRAELGMTSLLHSLNLEYSDESSAGELRFGITHCPLCAAAEKTGIVSETETAHYALRAICQSLTQTLDSRLQFQSSSGEGTRHVLSVSALSQ